MSIGHIDQDLAAKLPLDHIAEICHRYGVSELLVHGLEPGGIIQPNQEILFVVTFHDGDAGPWGSKAGRA